MEIIAKFLILNLYSAMIKMHLSDAAELINIGWLLSLSTSCRLLCSFEWGKLCSNLTVVSCLFFSTRYWRNGWHKSVLLLFAYCYSVKLNKSLPNTLANFSMRVFHWKIVRQRLIFQSFNLGEYQLQIKPRW